MRNYKFHVYFGSEFVEVITESATSAVILAMAQRIRDGKHTEASRCTRIDNGETTHIDSQQPCTINWVGGRIFLKP